jgi:hypothetical protein
MNAAAPTAAVTSNGEFRVTTVTSAFASSGFPLLPASSASATILRRKYAMSARVNVRGHPLAM